MGPAEPEMLCKVLIARLAGLKSELVAVAEEMDWDDLIALVRGSIRERIQQVRRFRK